MTWRDIEFNPPPRKLREFAAIMGALAGVSGIVLWHRGHFTHAKEIGLVIVAMVSITGLCLPRAVHWIYVGLMLATFPIAFVINYVVLAIVFYFVITPLALVFRMISRDALALKIRTGQSRWKPIAPKSPASYFRQH